MTSAVMAMTALGVCPVSAGTLAASETVGEKPYYASDTFDQLMAMDDAEFSAVLTQCDAGGIYGDSIGFYYYDETIPSKLWEENAENCGLLEQDALAAYCDTLGIPAQYVDEVEIEAYDEYGSRYDGYYDSNGHVVDDEIVFHHACELFLNTAAMGTSMDDAAYQRIAQTIVVLLYWNEDIFINPGEYTMLVGNTKFIGDINRDNTVDLMDAVLLGKCVAGSVTLWGIPAQNADVNADGLIDGMDNVILLQFLLHTVDTLPYTE